MSINAQTLKQKLLLHIEQLPDYKLQEVLDFVEFLLFRDETTKEQTAVKPQSQQEILAGLSHIRETVYQNYGVYQGDLVAENRADRDKQMDVNLGLDEHNESSP